ncbi:MAG TPA: class I SAM-dependent methyltransferase [Candidatus Binataceae bacterium]|nr:class I SAM-dependent methyltransferase [Candidatus Binataceae bacterium]
MAKVWPVHYALGVAGVALIRNWMAGDDAAKARVDELISLTRRLTEDPSLNFQLDIPDMEVESGYALWADTYDNFPNPLINVEEPIIRALLERMPAGRALDAACGTGRYTRYMRARGHEVEAVDVSRAMIAQARVSSPEVRFSVGSLEALPFTDGSFDLVMCGLALTHLPQISPAIVELARVLKPGGWAILADHHPVAGLLGGSAIFQDKDRFFRNVTSFRHGHAEYISAFVAAGLEIQECFEPEMTEEQAAIGPLFGIAPNAFRAGVVGVPMALIWLLRRR